MQDFVERADQTGDGGLRQGPRAVPGRTAGFKLKPARGFLGNINIVRPLAVTEADATTLRQQKFRIGNQIKVSINKPTGSLAPAFLFVRRTEEDDVAFERHPQTFEQDENHELRSGNALAVNGATTIHITILDRAGERIDFPISFDCRHHVEMMQQDESFFLTGAFESGVHNATSSLSLEHLGL